LKPEIIRVTAPEGRITARITLPSSKSISNRLLIMNALSGNKIRIRNLSSSNDTTVLLEALQPGKKEINAGNAGTAMRFLTAYLAVTEGEYILTGSERMCQRPVGKLVDALRQLGADIEYLQNEGFPPLKIRGKTLHKQEAEIDGSTSSQFISALLMIAPVLPHGLTLKLTGKIISHPYINLTLKLLKMAGIESVYSGNLIRIDPQPYRETEITAEPDWSSASYWYSIAALSGECFITICDLPEASLQGDAVIARHFATLGVKTEFTPEGAVLSRIPVSCSVFEENFEDTPDMVQTFVVCLGLLGIPFRISGAQSLRIKETDRIAALVNEMKKLGIAITEPENGVLEWNGRKEKPRPGPLRFSTYDDHRMAMSFAPVCLSGQPVDIEDPGVISKSYPGFWKDLEKAGFKTETSF